MPFVRLRQQRRRRLRCATQGESFARPFANRLAVRFPRVPPARSLSLPSPPLHPTQPSPFHSTRFDSRFIDIRHSVGRQFPLVVVFVTSRRVASFRLAAGSPFAVRRPPSPRSTRFTRSPPGHASVRFWVAVLAEPLPARVTGRRTGRSSFVPCRRRIELCGRACLRSPRSCVSCAADVRLRVPATLAASYIAGPAASAATAAAAIPHSRVHSALRHAKRAGCPTRSSDAPNEPSSPSSVRYHPSPLRSPTTRGKPSYREARVILRRVARIDKSATTDNSLYPRFL